MSSTGRTWVYRPLKRRSRLMCCNKPGMQKGLHFRGSHLTPRSSTSLNPIRSTFEYQKINNNKNQHLDLLLFELGEFKATRLCWYIKSSLRSFVTGVYLWMGWSLTRFTMWNSFSLYFSNLLNYIYKYKSYLHIQTNAILDCASMNGR